MPVFDLIEKNDNYLRKSGGLSQYYRNYLNDNITHSD